MEYIEIIHFEKGLMSFNKVDFINFAVNIADENEKEGEYYHLVENITNVNTAKAYIENYCKNFILIQPSKVGI